MIFFTADTHFFHARIIQLVNRPFRDVDEMNEAMVDNWNSVVRSGDVVYHLGDFAFGNKRAINDIRKRLNGRIVLLLGNHDREANFRGVDIEVIPLVKVRGLKIYALCRVMCGMHPIVLCHYALRVWDKSHFGVWHLYGHSHGSLPDDPNLLSLDVGVDCHKFTPVSFDRVCELMRVKLFKPVDHHGSDSSVT